MLLECRNHTYSSLHFKVNYSSRLKVKAQEVLSGLKEPRLARAQI